MNSCLGFWSDTSGISSVKVGNRSKQTFYILKSLVLGILMCKVFS